MARGSNTGSGRFNPGAIPVTLPPRDTEAGKEINVATKTIIITGAAGGLGSALAAVAVEQGWVAVMLDSDRRGLEQAYDRAEDAGPGQAALYPLDLAGAGPEDFEALLQTVVSEFGSIDALVHCAARFDSLTPLEHVQPQDWLGHIQVNLNAAWLLSACSLPRLREANGRLVFLLEDLDKVEGALWGPYGVAKHALKALVNQFALECKSSGVAVKGVDPGPMSTPLRARAFHAEHPKIQPEPLVVARQIMSYVSGDSDWPKTIVRL